MDLFFVVATQEKYYWCFEEKPQSIQAVYLEAAGTKNEGEEGERPCCWGFHGLVRHIADKQPLGEEGKIGERVRNLKILGDRQMCQENHA